MSYEIPGSGFGTLTADADLHTKQYLAVVVTSTGIAVAGAGVDIAGILQNKPVAGASCAVMADGVSKVVAGGSITRGNKVMINATGQAILATATNKAVGIALGAGASGEVIPVLLKDLGTQ